MQKNRFFRVPIFKIEGADTADTIRLRRISCLFYTLDVDQDTMQRIVKELGGEKVMPSFAEKLIKQGKQEGTIKGKQDLLLRLLRRKFGLSSSDEKMIHSVTDEVKLDAAAEAVLDAKSKDEVLKLLGQ